MRIALNLLLECLRHPERMPGLSLEQWDALLPTARVTALAGRLGGLARVNALYDQLPERPARHLMDAESQAGQQHVVLRWEVSRIERALRGLDTPIVLLKGAAYVQARLSARLGRECGDIDVLVADTALDRVEAALLAAGWEFDELDPRDQRYFRLWLQELPPMRHRERGASVDVHHALLPRTDRLFIDSEEFFKRSVAVDEGVSVLSPPDMVLHSAAHMFRNGDWSSALRDLSDQDMLLREFGARETFWEKLLERARAVRLTATCFYCLHYVQRYFQTPVPPAVLEQLLELKPAFPPLAALDAVVARAVAPRHDDRSDELRSLCLALLSHFPAPRPGAWLTPLFWLKRLPGGWFIRS